MVGLLGRVDDRPVALAVVTSRLGALVGRRVDGSPPWVFVGGTVEPGETPTEAAVREAQEEAGVTVVPSVVIAQRVHPRTDRLVIYVACVAEDPDSASVGNGRELVELRWVEAVELDGLMPDLFGPVGDRLHGRT